MGDGRILDASFADADDRGNSVQDQAAAVCLSEVYGPQVKAGGGGDNSNDGGQRGSDGGQPGSGDGGTRDANKILGGREWDALILGAAGQAMVRYRKVVDTGSTFDNPYNSKEGIFGKLYG